MPIDVHQTQELFKLSRHLIEVHLSKGDTLIEQVCCSLICT